MLHMVDRRREKWSCEVFCFLVCVGVFRVLNIIFGPSSRSKQPHHNVVPLKSNDKKNLLVASVAPVKTGDHGCKQAYDLKAH